MNNKWRTCRYGVSFILVLMHWGCHWCYAQEHTRAWRPKYHFTPKENWMNDPNGLVYDGGEYHLFYQYNPFANVWGHMSWGHATSTDLLSWQHQPVAIAEHDSIMIYSGSVIVDKKNAAGVCKSAPCFVAFYTGHTYQRESQHMAYSEDRGRSWQLYAKNPVLDIGYKDFRDPKVFWDDARSQWMMVVSIPYERKIRFYNSVNLRTWTLQGEFGPAGLEKESIWECPDLFPLSVEGTAESRWVLLLSLGAPNTDMRYFTGNFTGKNFMPDGPPKEVDLGRDFYAGVTFNGTVPGKRRIMLGWMNNWLYAESVPTYPWRSSMSIPRVLSLVKKNDGYYLRQKAIAQLDNQITETSTIKNLTLSGNRLIDLKSANVIVDVELPAQNTGIASLQFGDSTSRLRLDVNFISHSIDIIRSGKNHASINPGFLSNDRIGINDKENVHLKILYDRCLLEIFVEDGLKVASYQIYPSTKSLKLELSSDMNVVFKRIDIKVLSNR